MSIALGKVQDGESITPEYIEAAMQRIQGVSSSNSRSTNNDVFESQDFDFTDVYYHSLSTSEKDEIVEHALYTWQNKRNSGNYNRRPYNNKQSFNNNFIGGDVTHNERYASPKAETSQEQMINPQDIQTGEVLKIKC